MKYPLSEEVRFLIQSNAAVHMVYTQACRDEWTYEKFLEQAFLVQTRLNSILTRQIAHMFLTSPMPIDPVSFDVPSSRS